MPPTPFAPSSLHMDARREVESYLAPTPALAEMRADTLLLLDHATNATFRECRSGHVTASVIVMDPLGAVLLTHHAKYHSWMQLGGHLEPEDQTLQGAALREAIEESGITSGLVLEPGVLTMDIHPTSCPAPGGAHHDVVYLVRSPQGAVHQISEESTDLAWFMYLPENTDAHLHRAVAAARARL